MDKKEFAQIVAALKSVFTKPDFLPDAYSIETWYELLSDIPYEVAHTAALQYLAVEKFPPKPADIRERAAQIQSGTEELTMADAFAMYWDAVCDSGYRAQERFDALPEIVQRCAGSPSAMHDLAMTPDVKQSVERALFEKRFAIERDRIRAEAQIPASVREAIEKIAAGRQELLGTTA